MLSLNRMLSAALTPELHRHRFDVLAAPQLNPDVPYVEVVHCPDDRPEGWSVLRSGNDLNRIGYVALVDQMTVDHVRRAVARRAAPVLLDSDPADVAAVVVQRYHGMIGAPADVLSALVRDANDTLTGPERAVLRLAGSGLTVERMAEHLHFSDRHVRRLLHSVLAKAGTTSRAAAMEYFQDQLDPIDPTDA